MLTHISVVWLRGEWQLIRIMVPCWNQIYLQFRLFMTWSYGVVELLQIRISERPCTRAPQSLNQSVRGVYLHDNFFIVTETFSTPSYKYRSSRVVCKIGIWTFSTGIRPGVIYPEIAIICDYSFRRQFKTLDDLIAYLMITVNAVSLIYVGLAWRPPKQCFLFLSRTFRDFLKPSKLSCSYYISTLQRH